MFLFLFLFLFCFVLFCFVLFCFVLFCFVLFCFVLFLFLLLLFVPLPLPSAQYLTDEKGEVTSHLIGLFSRTVRWIDVGIRPVYVFDGKPPVLKGGELAKRSSRKRAAAVCFLLLFPTLLSSLFLPFSQKVLEEASEEGNVQEMEKMAKRTVHISRQMTEDCKKLLRLMGVPVIQAPCEGLVLVLVSVRLQTF